MSLYKQHLPENRRYEFEHLICFSRTVSNDEPTPFKEDMDWEGFDWNGLIQISFQHRVMPLLYRNLIRFGANRVPDEFMEELRHRYLNNTTHNIYLTEQLLKVLNLLEEQNIFTVPFKGPLLAQYLYGDIGSRQFSDLDILIHKKDVIKTRKLLLTNGYRDSMHLDDRQFMAFARTYSQNVFLSHDGRVNLELHWEMSNRHISVELDMQELKGCIEEVVLEGKTVNHLKVNELLLYLCLHGTKHYWENLEMVCCVSELIRSHPEINWNKVLGLAARLRSERAVYLGLFLAHDLYGVKLPDKIIDKITDDSMIHSIVKKVYRNSFQTNGTSSELSIKSQSLLYHMSVRNRLSEKIWFCFDEFVRPKVKDWIVFPLPSALSFLHYLLRPMRLMYKWLLRIPSLKVSEKLIRQKINNHP